MGQIMTTTSRSVHQTRRPALASRTAHKAAEAFAGGKAGSDARERFRVLMRALVPPGVLKAGTFGRWRHDDMAAGTQKRNPAADLYEHLTWAADVRCAAGHAAAAAERDGLALLEAIAADYRAHVARHAPATPVALALVDVDETRAQAEADVAVRLALSAPADATERAALIDAARRAAEVHVGALRRLLDRLSAERLASRQAAKAAARPLALVR